MRMSIDEAPPSHELIKGPKLGRLAAKNQVAEPRSLIAREVAWMRLFLVSSLWCMTERGVAEMPALPLIISLKQTNLLFAFEWKDGLGDKTNHMNRGPHGSFLLLHHTYCLPSSPQLLTKTLFLSSQPLPLVKLCPFLWKLNNSKDGAGEDSITRIVRKIEEKGLSSCIYGWWFLFMNNGPSLNVWT